MDRVQQDQAYAKALERFVSENGADPEVLHFCQYAASWIAWHPCGIWASPIMENVIRGFGSAHTFVNAEPAPKNNKALLVMTHAFQSGGHTRLAEAIIRESSRESVDVFIDSPEFPIPSTLSDLAVSHRSSIIQSQTISVLQTTATLQNLARAYKGIVLLTHPEDPIPVLCFAQADWKTPVYLYNHADHQFWFGVSAADVVLNLSTKAAEFSKAWRGTSHNGIQPIPIQPRTQTDSSRTPLRVAYGVEDSTYLIFSAGSAYKYNPLGSRNFVNAILDAMQKTDRDILCIVAGPSPSLPLWKNALEQSHGRIRALGTLNHDQFQQWLSAADLYVDSIPTSGWTTVLEAMAADLAIVFEDNGEFFPDCMMPFASPLGTASRQITQRIQQTHSKNNFDLSSHMAPKWGQSFWDLLNKHATHCAPVSFSVPCHSEIDELTPILRQSMQPSHDRHGWNYLLDFSFSFRLKVFAFFLIHRQWKVASVVLFLNRTRYSFLKRVFRLFGRGPT